MVENIVETKMIAVLVLLVAMGCLALSIYKVKEWYRRIPGPQIRMPANRKR